MKRWITALAGVCVLGTGLASVPARASGYDEGYDEGYGAPVVTRRIVVERPVVVRPRPVVREVVVERPIVVRPREVVREVVVERSVVYRPRPIVREVVVERERFGRDGFEPRRFGPSPYRPHAVGYDDGRGPAYDPYD